MVCDRIRELCGDDFLIEYRMSGSERVEGGQTLEDGIAFAKLLQDHVDLIHVTSGYYQDHVNTKAFSSMFDKHGCNLDLAEAINEQGRTGDAVQYVNQVRSRAGMPGYNSGPAFLQVSDQASMRKCIQLERRWELAAEEVLYYDELRQGTWKDFRYAPGNGLLEPWGTTVYETIWGGKEYLHWAIPAKEIEMNRNLVQNDGWKG